LAHKIRFLADQFDVEHRGIIEVQSSAARSKPIGCNLVNFFDAFSFCLTRPPRFARI
jgi:hypothetical protein